MQTSIDVEQRGVKFDVMEDSKNDQDDQEITSTNKDGGGLKVGLLSLAFELGFSIAIPIAGLALLGQVMDKWFLTSPVFLLVGIFLSMPIAVALIYRKVKNVLE